MKSMIRYRVLAVFGVLACLGLVAYGVVQIANGPIRNISRAMDGDLRFSEKQILSRNLEPFGEISLRGGINIRIVKGKPGISLYGDKADDVLLKINKSGDRLELSVDDGLFLDTRVPAVMVSVENLDSLVFKGAGNVRISDFQLGKLSISADGALNITLTGLLVNDLDINLNGAANIDASTSWIKNAVLEMDGMSNLKLGMNGGTLKGAIKGVSNVSYWGAVSDKNINTEGSLGVVKQISENPLSPPPTTVNNSKVLSDTKE